MRHYDASLRDPVAFAEGRPGNASKCHGNRSGCGDFDCAGPILLLGAPAVGKGTQARELAKLWAVPQISTGDLLRAHVYLSTDLGQIAEDLMSSGQLVPIRWSTRW